ncbi:hypothetical protein P872_15820 [Rhodonellum psychrophilum GCM71 = DSM 17998]|uniref:Uncharacterized protein n=1 Tax=Rhodonellum psychrophilum GCM71 = DSM 17998 TaxID=1123057 RepID=U5C357_9BACT|nr:hypothetical protein P872_15820 [Rhodonellum psychrophilum GCM71 = DSM 17998]
MPCYSIWNKNRNFNFMMGNCVERSMKLTALWHQSKKSFFVKMQGNDGIRNEIQNIEI